MILKIFRGYKIGKTIYSKILKPIYEELRKDAYASENTELTKRKTKKNAKHQKSNGSHRRKENP